VALASNSSVELGADFGSPGQRLVLTPMPRGSPSPVRRLRRPGSRWIHPQAEASGHRIVRYLPSMLLGVKQARCLVGLVVWRAASLIAAGQPAPLYRRTQASAPHAARLDRDHAAACGFFGLYGTQTDGSPEPIASERYRTDCPMQGASRRACRELGDCLGRRGRQDSLVVRGALFNQRKIARGPRSFSVKRCRKQREAPNAIFPAAEGVTRSPRGHDRGSVAVDLTSDNARQITPQSIEPSALASVNGEYVATVWRIGKRAIAFGRFGANAFRRMSRIV